ncbi:MAG: sugar phosphate phosphatase [Lentisphaerae bacterium ADurb.BinA184]|nr:MAG: sugar phosphate phosphatase [Lentisphaerae bacterium ADurb.BinA184]
MNPIRLICTDFDGTFVGDQPRPQRLMEFRDLLRPLARQCGTRWAIVTGRRLGDLRPALAELAGFALAPDYLIVEDALIYRNGRHGPHLAFAWWNLGVRRRRAGLLHRNMHEVVRWRDGLLTRFPAARDRSRQVVDLWVEFADDDQATRAEILLRDWSYSPRGHRFFVFRWGNEVFLAPAAGTKGEAVTRLRQALRLLPHAVFAIGDGPNDLTMLDGRAAGLPACVGNAIEHVKETVRRNRGYVAAGEDLAGVVEALRHWAAAPPTAGVPG